MDDIKSELKAKLQSWGNIKSRWVKAASIILFLGLIALKIFTTVLTFDWLSRLVDSI
ncbi:MAG: hypothetical protein ACI9B9_001530 [Halioglobus sp.]|jgi:hypothetical protein